MKILLGVLMFFIIGALLIISNNSLALAEKENIEIFYDSYVGWMNQLYTNTQTLTGNVVKLNWLPNNSS